jgi:hypothetical protein
MRILFLLPLLVLCVGCSSPQVGAARTALGPVGVTVSTQYGSVSYTLPAPKGFAK